jgi:hypothetical protein
VPNVQWKTPDDGQSNCPKHVEFLDKNKFGKLVRLFILLKEICYDARSHELKKNNAEFWCFITFLFAFKIS